MATKTKHRDDARVTPEGYSFDDIEQWMMVRYRGKRGFVSEIGEDVIEGTSSKHIRVDLLDPDKNNPALHSETVKTYLMKKKVLWVDFEHRFISADEVDDNA